MFTMNSVRRKDVLTLIKTVPGITKPQIMAALNLKQPACEMHLTRLSRDGSIYSTPGDGQKAWHPAETKPVRFASVFDYAQRMETA